MRSPQAKMHTIAVLLVVCFMLRARYMLRLILFHSLLGLLGSSELTLQPKLQALADAPVCECLMGCNSPFTQNTSVYLKMFGVKAASNSLKNKII